MDFMMILLWTSLGTFGALAVKLGLESDGLHQHKTLGLSIFFTFFTFIIVKFQFGYLLSSLEFLGVYFLIAFSMRLIMWLLKWRDIRYTNKIIKQRVKNFK